MPDTNKLIEAPPINLEPGEPFAHEFAEMLRELAEYLAALGARQVEGEWPLWRAADLDALASWLELREQACERTVGSRQEHGNFLGSEEWRRVRMMALERDGARCACCGRTAADGVKINVDHIKPRRFHPELALTLTNLQVLCDACNHGKGNRFSTDWRGSDPFADMSPEDVQRHRSIRPRSA